MFYDQPQPIKHLSVSKVELALLCPHKLKLQYVDQIPQPSVGKLTAGSVVHDVIEHAFRQFVSTGSYPSWKDMDDRYLPTWKRLTLKEEKKPNFLGWQWEEGDPEEKVRDECRVLVRLAREEVLPTMKPWILRDGEPAVELRIDLELDSRVGKFPLLGFLDFLTSDGLLGDWKTTEKVSPRAKSSFLQFAAYSIFVKELTKKETVYCEKIFLVRGKKPHVERCPFTITQAHRDYFTELAARVWEMIHYGIYMKNSENWMCRPKWCPFHAGCRGSVVKKEEASDE